MKVVVYQWSTLTIDQETAPKNGEHDMSPEEIVNLASKYDIMIKTRNDYDRLTKQQKATTQRGSDITIIEIDNRGGGFRMR